jgi:hypothetical protein
MSEPTSPSDPTPPVPPAPTFTYGSPAAPPPQPAAAAPAAPSQPLPPPAYGERLPGYEYAAPAAPPAYGVAPSGAPAYGTPVRRRRTWDVVLTIILLVVGLFGMIIGLVYASIFADPTLVRQVFDEAFRQYGLGSWNGSVGAAPTVIAVSHIVLYLVALGVGILLLVTKRIAFWVPLAAGVVAAIVFWAALYSVVLSDPALLTGSF